MTKFDELYEQIIEKVTIDWKSFGKGILDIPAYPYNKYQRIKTRGFPEKPSPYEKLKIPGGTIERRINPKRISLSGRHYPEHIKVNRTIDLTKPEEKKPFVNSKRWNTTREPERLAKAKGLEPKTTKSALRSKPSRPRPPKRGVGFSAIRGADKK